MLSTAAPMDVARSRSRTLTRRSNSARYRRNRITPFNADIRACTSTSPVNPTVSCKKLIRAVSSSLPPSAEPYDTASAEGGKDDETALISFLQDTVGFTGDVLVQARMSALNGVILLRRYRAEFERLVKVLERDRATSIGAAVLSIDDVA